ncbi:MAG: hypothetical protein AAB839_01235 [Patescibacteria group bacterium]
MARRSRLFPAWALPGRDFINALHVRWPKAIAALRDEKYQYSPSVRWLLEDERLATLQRIMRNPAPSWDRHVRKSKKGDEKRVYSPNEELRMFQRAAMGIFPRPTNRWVATAFGRGCSIIENAKPHRNGRSSFRIDIQDAFPSISTLHIVSYLVRKGVNEDLAWLVARLWTYRGRLEQGAPVAPEIFNAMLERLDEDLCMAVGAPYSWGHEPGMRDYEETQRPGDPGHPLQPRSWVEFHRPDPEKREVLVYFQDCSFPGALRRFWYTRYGDDMCFSYVDDEFPKELEAIIEGIVLRHGFVLNPEKTKRGWGGIVDLPGVAIMRGRIRVNGIYRRRLLEIERSLLPKQREGHRAYVSSFGRGGYLRVLRDVLGPRLNRQGPPYVKKKKKGNAPVEDDDPYDIPF